MKLPYKEVQSRLVRKNNETVRKKYKCMFYIKGKCSKDNELCHNFERCPYYYERKWGGRVVLDTDLHLSRLPNGKINTFIVELITETQYKKLKTATKNFKLTYKFPNHGKNFNDYDVSAICFIYEKRCLYASVKDNVQIITKRNKVEISFGINKIQTTTKKAIVTAALLSQIKDTNCDARLLLGNISDFYNITNRIEINRMPKYNNDAYDDEKLYNEYQTRFNQEKEIKQNSITTKCTGSNIENKNVKRKNEVQVGNVMKDSSSFLVIDVSKEELKKLSKTKPTDLREFTYVFDSNNKHHDRYNVKSIYFNCDNVCIRAIPCESILVKTTDIQIKITFKLEIISNALYTIISNFGKKRIIACICKNNKMVRWICGSEENYFKWNKPTALNSRMENVEAFFRNYENIPLNKLSFLVADISQNLYKRLLSVKPHANIKFEYVFETNNEILKGYQISYVFFYCNKSFILGIPEYTVRLNTNSKVTKVAFEINRIYRVNKLIEGFYVEDFIARTIVEKDIIIRWYKGEAFKYFSKPEV